MVTEIISAITGWVTGMVGAVVNAVNGIVPLFYDTTANHLTFVGTLALMGLGIGIVGLGIAFVRRLIAK